MEVILSDEKISEIYFGDKKYTGQVGDGDRKLAIEAQRHLLNLLKEKCKHGIVTFDCPECIKEIEKAVNEAH
jgi:hypothetical protein